MGGLGVHTFPKGLCPKVNIIVQLEFELTYYDSAVQRFNHHTWFNVSKWFNKKKKNPLKTLCFSSLYEIQSDLFPVFSRYITEPLASWIVYSPMVRETWVQSHGRAMLKTQKIVLDTTLLNTPHYKVRIKGKVEQSRGIE